MAQKGKNREMKTFFYKLRTVDGMPQLVESENGQWVRREDYERVTQGLVDELAERDRAVASRPLKPAAS